MTLASNSRASSEEDEEHVRGATRFFAPKRENDWSDTPAAAGSLN